MKRRLTHSMLARCLGGVMAITGLPISQLATAQSLRPQDLSYDFYGRSINLTLREDVVAVNFKQTGNTRGGTLPYQQLQQALTGGTRGGTPLQVKVHPLGQRYAVVSFPSGSRSTPAEVKQRLDRLPYVENTLPVLSRSDRQETIVLPNEIVLSFDTSLVDQAAADHILKRYSLEVLREVPFSKNQVIVRATRVSGVDVLRVAGQLSQVQGVRSATPNFVQSVPYQIQGQLLNPAVLNPGANAEADLKRQLSELSGSPQETAFPSKLVPLQWHLDSRPRRGSSLPRTDVHAVEAWQQAQNDGEGVVVAVIDSLIQWDHPDLEGNLYQVGNVADKLPDEQHGWDFAENDADTRISAQELESVRPMFQDTFRLSDPQLLGQFPDLASTLEYYYPGLSKGELATFLRNILRREIAAEFHGTWSAGVIAAHAPDQQGVMGVAPKAKILPVRVFGLGGSVSMESLMGAVRYAAARNADVINLSLGGPIPFPGLVETFFEVLDEHPDLVIVASAGNENLDGVGFPAAIPGVLSVGATNLPGQRTFYSSYGGRLDLVAPGGDTSQVKSGGILTTGGTFPEGFWQGLESPQTAWGDSLDARGRYVQVQGTSFSAPAVSGVVALMKGEDPKRRLTRDQLLSILKDTSTHQTLQVSQADQINYRLQSTLGFGTVMSFPFARPSGIFALPEPRSPQEYYYGSGLVNAADAVLAVQKSQ